MAFISQNEKKIVASQVKPVLAKFGLKGTLSIQHHSKLILTISSGKIDFIANYNTGLRALQQSPRNDDYINVNEYHYKWVFSGEAADAITQLYAAMRTADWKDESDIMTDYFNISYYVDINIGTYNKSYKVTG